MITERVARRALILIAIVGLAAGLVAYTRGESVLAHWIWAGATVPVERRIRLVIPSGLVDGTQLRVAGDGSDAGAGSIPGDLLVDVGVREAPRDPRFVRYLALLLLLVSVATLAIYVVSH